MLDSHNTCQHEAKGKREAMVIKKRIENFDFVCMLVVQCKILQIVHIALKAMQCQTIDLISAHKLLQTAAEKIAQLRRSFDAVLNEASTNASTWGLPRQFLNKRAKITKVYFDQTSEGITLSNPKKLFCVTVFLSMMAILSCQLINRFEGMKSVVTSYQVLESSFYQMLLIWILRLKQENFLTNFLITSLRCFLAKCSPSKRRLEKKLPISNLPKKWLLF